MRRRRPENHTESTEEKVGEATGGIAGALAGAGLGSLAGPVGAIVGGVAGAVGGWWAGEKAGRAIEDWTDEDERAVRKLYDSRAGRDGDVTYDAARAGYLTGYMAADHPEYRDHDAMDVELREHWGWRDYDYERLHPYVQGGYDRRRSLITR